MAKGLETITPRVEFTEGAWNAVNVCLRVRSGEKVTLITDRETEEIGASIYQEILNASARCSVFVLDDYGARPHRTMPPEILRDLSSSQVSVYAAQGQPGELVTRMQMTAVVTEHRIRHAHMINVTPRIMMEGMRADFRAVDEISTRVYELARQAARIRARTPLGTDLHADLSPRLRWLKTSGIISPEKWGNLPGGEIFTSPAMVNGTFVVDGVVGDYLCARYGDLSGTPLELTVKEGRLQSARSKNTELEREFWDYCHTDSNSDRVGEFAIGTNIALRRVIGNILQDEKIPGVHIAFGHPYAEHTGADWKSGTHIDVVGTQFDIWIDERKIMEKGQFLL
ncbi:MAG TPA: aminopeptidase [Bacteroidota bacterium]|nr:aminopeptidase [Bacteroidota bacterium]